MGKQQGTAKWWASLSKARRRKPGNSCNLVSGECVSGGHHLHCLPILTLSLGDHSLTHHSPGSVENLVWAEVFGRARLLPSRESPGKHGSAGASPSQQLPKRLDFYRAHSPTHHSLF